MSRAFFFGSAHLPWRTEERSVRDARDGAHWYRQPRARRRLRRDLLDDAPQPFLKYYYATFPSKLPEHLRPKSDVAAPTSSPADAPADAAADTTKEQKSKAWVYASDPILDKLITEGRHRGRRCIERRCMVPVGNGVCGVSLSWLNRPEELFGSTTPIIKHIRYYAEEKAQPEPGHVQVLAELNGANAGVVEVDGKMVKVMRFGEAFPHHVNFAWMRAAGLVSGNMSNHEEFCD